jgi:glyoxylase-like metal-dependent hydrolase (beta-lactamase superfamily II)
MVPLRPDERNRRIFVAKGRTSEPVARGVHRVDAVGLSSAISVLLIEGDDGFMLVDTGLSSSAGRLQEALAVLGGRPEDLKRIYITHHHLDHIGGLPDLLEWAPDAEVMASEHEAEIISGRREPDPSSNPIFRFFSRHQNLPTVPVDRVMHEGEKVDDFRVVSTPGHTLGHTSLLRDEDGLLFTGDAFGALVRRMRVGGAKFVCTDPSLAKRSAERLLTEDFDTVVMTHGGTIHAGARRQLKEAVDRCNYA